MKDEHLDKHKKSSQWRRKEETPLVTSSMTHPRHDPCERRWQTAFFSNTRSLLYSVLVLRCALRMLRAESYQQLLDPKFCLSEALPALPVPWQVLFCLSGLRGLCRPHRVVRAARSDCSIGHSVPGTQSHRLNISWEQSAIHGSPGISLKQDFQWGDGAQTWGSELTAHFNTCTPAGVRDTLLWDARNPQTAPHVRESG